MITLLTATTLAMAGAGGWLEPIPGGKGPRAELGPAGSGLGIHLDVGGGYGVGALSPSYATYQDRHAALFEHAQGRLGRAAVGVDLNETLDFVVYTELQESVEHFYSDTRGANAVVRGILQPHLGAELRVVHRRYPYARPYMSIGGELLLTGDYDLVTDDGGVNLTPEEIRPGKPWWGIPGLRAGVGVDLRPRGERSLTALYVQMTGTQLFYPYRLEENEVFFEASRQNLVPAYGSVTFGAGLRLYPQMGRSKTSQLPPVLGAS